jgi:hypothetical protein
MTDRIAARYRRFAQSEARGHSPLYETLANGIASDDATLRFLESLPEHKKQPNLLFAAQRYVCGTATGWFEFRQALLANQDGVRDAMLNHLTQTNEAARCAVLVPFLAEMKPPLALIEVGASAGLCLLPDRYSYDYGMGVIGADEPRISCRLSGGITIPRHLPEVTWRAGLDLNPIDVNDAHEVAWLEALIWPDQPDRLLRLRQAMAIARRAPPMLRRGNLTTDLPALVAEAPKDATVVVFHTAVLAYVDDASLRDAFANHVRQSGAIWLSNEAPSVFPDMSARAGPSPRSGSFLLSINGEPLAWTDPHGAWAEGIARNTSY